MKKILFVLALALGCWAVVTTTSAAGLGTLGMGSLGGLGLGNLGSCFSTFPCGGIPACGTGLTACGTDTSAAIGGQMAASNDIYSTNLGYHNGQFGANTAASNNGYLLGAVDLKSGSNSCYATGGNYESENLSYNKAKSGGNQYVTCGENSYLTGGANILAGTNSAASTNVGCTTTDLNAMKAGGSTAASGILGATTSTRSARVRAPCF